METDVFLNDDIITDKFKSYYVVWKQEDKKITNKQK